MELDKQEISIEDFDSTDLEEAGWSCEKCPRKDKVVSRKLECSFPDCFYHYKKSVDNNLMDDIIANKLCQESLNAGHSGKIVSDLEKNDNYKVCYRFLANMLSKWKELGFESFPTEEKAISIAKKSHAYFEFAFKDLHKLDEFRRLYYFHKDVWKDVNNE